MSISLGYERIINDKRISIEVDDSDDPWVTLKFQGCPEVVRLKASGGISDTNPMDFDALYEEYKANGGTQSRVKWEAFIKAMQKQTSWF